MEIVCACFVMERDGQENLEVEKTVFPGTVRQESGYRMSLIIAVAKSFDFLLITVGNCQIWVRELVI